MISGWQVVRTVLWIMFTAWHSSATWMERLDRFPQKKSQVVTSCNGTGTFLIFMRVPIHFFLAAGITGQLAWHCPKRRPLVNIAPCYHAYQQSKACRTNGSSFCTVPALGATTFFASSGPKALSLLRHSHHPRPRPASGHERSCTHSLGNRTCSSTPRRAWAHQRPPSQPPCLLGFLGWHTAHSHRQDLPNTATIFQHLHRGTCCRPIAAGNHRSTTTTPTSRLQPSHLGWTGSSPSPRLGPTKHIQPSVKDGQRHAAQSSHAVSGKNSATIPTPPAKPCWIPIPDRTPAAR